MLVTSSKQSKIKTGDILRSHSQNYIAQPLVERSLWLAVSLNKFIQGRNEIVRISAKMKQSYHNTENQNNRVIKVTDIERTILYSTVFNESVASGKRMV